MSRRPVRDRSRALQPFAWMDRRSLAEAMLPVAGPSLFVRVGDDENFLFAFEVDDFEWETGDASRVDLWLCLPAAVEAPLDLGSRIL